MKTFIFVLVVLTCVCHTIAQQAPRRKIVLKVNLGGGPVGDFLGEDQVLETEGLHKATTGHDIQNTDQKEIFQSQRFARGEDFVMRLPVPDGIYSVTLLFAETYEKACIPGGRVFDISLGTPISGVVTIFRDFDVFQAAGCKAAHGKRFNKVPSKEGIVVHLKKKVQHPSLAGFVVEGFPVPKGDGSEYRAVGQVQPEETAGGGMDQGMPASASLHDQPAGSAQGSAIGDTELNALGGPPLNAGNPDGIPSTGTGPMINHPLATNDRLAEGEQRKVGLQQPGRVGSDLPQLGQSEATARPGGILPQRGQLQPSRTTGMLA